MTPVGSVLVEHVSGGGPSGPPPGLPLLATAALYVAVVAAGLLIAPVMTRIEGRPRLRLPVITATAVAYVGLLIAMTVRDEAGPLTVVAAGLAVAVGLLAAARRSAADQVAAGAGIVAVQGALIGTVDGVEHLLVVVVHLAAAALWLGGVLHLAAFATRSADRAALGRGIRSFTPYAVGSAATLAGTGLVLLVVHHVGWAALGGTAFGRVVVAKSVLLVLAGGVGLTHRRAGTAARSLRRPALVRAEAGVLSSALVLAVVLTGLPAPVPAFELAAPGLAVLRLPGDQTAGLFVSKATARTGLVEVVSPESLRVTDLRTGRVTDLEPGQSLPVRLAGGLARLAVSGGTSTVTVTLPAQAAPVRPTGDAATSDRTGWLGYQLGRALALAGTRSSGTSDVRAGSGLAPHRDGVALAGLLRNAGVRRVRAYSDGSQRARRLIAGLAAHGVPANRHDGAPFALLATDAANARRVLARIAARRHPSVRGIYLAPWLLDGAVLSTLTSLRLPPLLVPAPVDPMSPTADRYRAALAVAAGGIAPSVAGLLGWLSVVSPAAGSDDVLTLYAATPVGFLPGVLDVGHQHGTTGWFTGGTLVATSAPVPVPMSQGVH